MLRNELKSRLKNGEIVYGTMVQEMTSPTVAQIFQRSGFDFIMIDCEHSPYDHSTVREILRVARLEKLTEMKKEGMIDDDEFKQMKKEILGK